MWVRFFGINNRVNTICEPARQKCEASKNMRGMRGRRARHEQKNARHARQTCDT